MPANLASSRPLRALSLAALALLMAAPALAQSRRQGAELPQMRLSQRPLIVAHRGRATPDGAENSLVQMQQVASHQIGVEMDLAASQDGVLYLLHDATLDRTTTGIPIGSRASRMSSNSVSSGSVFATNRGPGASVVSSSSLPITIAVRRPPL